MKNARGNNSPFVSIIIPCRDEEKFIRECLDSIAKQDYLKEKMEVLVVDGMSEDRTREIIKNYLEKHSSIKLLNNPRKFTNFAFNTGIQEARGKIIMLMGAHATYKKDYISKCVKYLNKYNADNVGGVIKTLPINNTVIAKAITIVLSHPFGAGGSYFRISTKESKEVDTVFGGCYKREVFDKIGLFNKNLIRSQDIEFNLRLKRAGGKILLVPDIVSYYYPKSNLKDFFLQNLKTGFWVTYSVKFTKTPLKLRHYLPLIFILTLPLSIWPYISISLFFSVQIAIKEKDFRLFFITPLTFMARHFGYGLGSVWGIIKCAISKR